MLGFSLILLSLWGFASPSARAQLGTAATGHTWEPGDLLSYDCVPVDPNKSGFSFPGFLLLNFTEDDPSTQTFLAIAGSRGLKADEHKFRGAKFGFGNLNGREIGPPYSTGPVNYTARVSISKEPQATVSSTTELTADGKIRDRSSFSILPNVGQGNSYVGSLTLGGKTFPAACKVGNALAGCPEISSTLILAGAATGGEVVISTGMNFGLSCGVEKNAAGAVIHDAKSFVSVHLHAKEADQPGARGKDYLLTIPSNVVESPRREKYEAAVRMGNTRKADLQVVRELALRWRQAKIDGLQGDALRDEMWSIADELIAAIVEAK